MSSLHRLDILRDDIALAMNLVAVHLELAAVYLDHGEDERFRSAMVDVRDRLKTTLALTNRLTEEARSAEIIAAAAQEWRAERDAQRRTRTRVEAA